MIDLSNKNFKDIITPKNKKDSTTSNSSPKALNTF